MKLKMKNARIIAGLTALALLAGCGTKREYLDVVVASLSDLQRAISGEKGPTVRETLTEEGIRGLGQPYLFLDIPLHASQSGMIRARMDGSIETWYPGSYQNTIALKDGVVLQTRGIGGDLMSLDGDAAIAAISAGQGEALRVHRWLDGSNQIVAKAFFCDYSSKADVAEILFGQYPGHRVDESCSGSGDSFENQYWFDSAGVMRKSYQWLTPTIGSVWIERVIDR